jgi:hypothetical protein
MTKLSKNQRTTRYGNFRKRIILTEHNKRKKENPAYGKPTEKELPNFVKEKVNESVHKRKILQRPLKYVQTA